MAAVIVSIKDHPEYVDVVSKWCYNEWLEENADCGIFSEAQYKEDIIKNYLRTDTAWPVLLVAVLLSGEPCGTVALDGRDMSQRPDLSPWLASLFVSPQFRRRGIGLQLVRGLQDVVRSLPDVHKIHLWVDIGKKQLKMYEECGFAKLEQLRYCGNTVAIMAWTATAL